MGSPEVNVTFFDTTARDGAQALPEANQFPDGAKVEVARHIAGLGVGVIEAGFPRTPSDGMEVREVARTVGRMPVEVAAWQSGQQRASVFRTPVIAGLSRTKAEDIDATWEAVRDADRPRIHTFISTSDFHREAKFPGVSREKLLLMGRDAVAYAKNISAENPHATVEFSAEAASTTDMKYLEQVVRSALAEGADVINLPDTVGERDPIWMYNFYRKAVGWVAVENASATISAHNHNDLANAVPNTLMLVRAAADHAAETGQSINVQLETTIGGLGERAGNADIFPVAAGLFKFSPEYSTGVNWEINTEKSVSVAREVMRLAGLTVDRQNPVVGQDTNVHRSGIHSDGVLKGGHRMYTPQDPRMWGHASDAVYEDGKYQGRAGRAAIGQA